MIEWCFLLPAVLERPVERVLLPGAEVLPPIWIANCIPRLWYSTYLRQQTSSL